MHIETEIKYLIDKLPANLPSPNYIEQRYFLMDGKEEVLKNIFQLDTLLEIKTCRIRLIKDSSKINYVLTLKSSGLYSRKEYEKIIDYNLYQEFLKQPITSCIIKNRYTIEKNNFVFEFDEYLNLNQSLYTVEIETDNLNNTCKIERILNDVFQIKYLDVSLNPKYKNSNLQKYFGK